MAEASLNTNALETPENAAATVPVLLMQSDTPLRRAIRRFRRNHIAVLGLVVLTIIVLSAAFAPYIAQHEPLRTDLRSLRKPPSEQHWLGTDKAGRDVFARVLYGGQVSLQIGVLSVLLYTSAGISLGLLSGYYGGWIDTGIMRATDAMMALPSLLVILMMVTITEPSLRNIIVAIAVTRWPGITRLVRGQVLSVRQMEYVTAARAIGASPFAMMYRHLLPNVLAPVIVSASFGVASAILTEGALSFLGLGIQPPTPSWGNMLVEAQSITVLKEMPWYWIPPGTIIAVTVLCINFVGDGLRDALDPRSDRRM